MALIDSVSVSQFILTQVNGLISSGKEQPHDVKK